MSKHAPVGLVINGWTVFAHPLFLDQVEALAQQAEDLKRRNPGTFSSSHAVKRLAAIYRLAFVIIPQDPARPEYRQGNTLGREHRHWFRAKFYQRYRLFFRYHASTRIIVYAWVNDEGALRARERSDDVYRVFRTMLQRGRPPGDWDKLLAEARRERNRLKQVIELD